MSEAASENEQVTVRAADLRALLEAVDTDYVSTENLPALEERIDRLAAAVGLGDGDLEYDDDRDAKDMDPHYYDGAEAGEEQ